MNRLQSVAKKCWSLWLFLVLTGCETTAYYAQAAKGQLSIYLNKVPVEQALADNSLPEEYRHLLAQVPQMLAYAHSRLLLPNQGSYQHFVNLPRRYVVWNVVAAPEFEMQPVVSCFPLAGCVSYRGYFDLAGAKKKRDEYQSKGLDVLIGGVEAYSTLGWFKDPVLSSMLRRTPSELAGLLFHELAHKKYYWPNHTSFNEAFATAVEQIGVSLWLTESADAQQVAAYQQRKAAEAQVVKLILSYRDQLAALYEQNKGLNKTELRQEKQRVLAELKGQYQALLDNGVPAQGYRGFFNSDLNNASLLAFADYHAEVARFKRLYAQSGEDFASFYQKVEQEAKRLGL